MTAGVPRNPPRAGGPGGRPPQIPPGAGPGGRPPQIPPQPGPDSGAARSGAGQPGRPERPRLTTRAAVLAVVLCAIALSLAYPVREYIAQRRQIDGLEAQQQQVAAQISKLEAKRRQLSSNAYVEQQARDKLHMCLPTKTCYVVINRKPHAGRARARATRTPWYERLWGSVKQAGKAPGR